MQIKKRDGRLVSFNKYKIIDAVLKAFKAVDGEISDYATEKANNIANYIEKECESFSIMGIETVQDMIEQGLMSCKRKDVARAYITYRNKRTEVRERHTQLLTQAKEKLNGQKIENQNANVDEHSFGGRKGEAANIIYKQIAIEDYMSEKAKENHLNNVIYTHDLDSYAVGQHNCLSIPFDDLLANGFNTRQSDIRPAGSLSSAFQLLAVIFQLQSLDQFGGVSATHLDWTMVPYVRKSFYKHWKRGLKYIENSYADFQATSETPIDKYPECKALKYALDMTINEAEQSIEALYHNLNTLQSRSGNQLPFTSINYGTCTLPEGRLVIKAILDGSIKGVGKLHKTPVFPCGIFQYWKGVNDKPGTPNYDLYRLALQSTAKRLYPNYVNVDWSGNKGFDPNDPCTYMSTMGCRTANGWDINGLGQRKDGRGNICPVTIILPTVAMMAKQHADAANDNGDYLEAFMYFLDQKISEAKDQLIERFEWIAAQSPESAPFMYENHTMAGYIEEEGIRSALKHGTLALGQLGLAEALHILIGCDHTTEKGMEAAKKIEALFKKRCAEFKEQYKLNFGVYYTPAENLCYTAMKKFKEKYGEIPKVSDHEYFTNSMHIPVWHEISPFDKIDLESQLTPYSSAGCITYVELDGGVSHNIDALETLVNYAMDHDIPYFAINVPNDTCLECGYTGEFNNECPMCGSHNIQQLRRVTGYLTGNYTTAFNLGKQAEVKDRVKHGKGNIE